MELYLSQSRTEEPLRFSPVEKFILAEGEIESLDSQIEKLTHNEDEVALLALVSDILPPAHRLPIEILSEIFELVCYPNHGRFYPQFDVVRTTTSLSQVCVVWRQVAHDTPRIWSNLCLSIPEHMNLFNAGGKWVNEWLSRSGVLPLGLYLDFPTDNSNWSTEEEMETYSEYKSLVQEVHYLLDQILDHRHYLLDRIRSIKLIGDPIFFTPVFVLGPTSFRGVERISMQMTRSLDENLRVNSFSSANNLRHLEIVEPYFRSQLRTFLLPAGQLINLQIRTRNYSHFDTSVYANFLHRCSSLVSLEINPACSPVFNSPTDNVFLPMLKSLSFIFHPSYDDEFPGVSILHILAVPLLEEMTLDVQRIELLDLATDMTALQGNSPTPNLKSLTLEMGRMHNDPDDLTSALALFPTITSLRLNGILFDMNPLFKAMTSTQSNVNFVLLPRIVNLELECRRDTAYPSELISMILSRSSIADAGLVSVLQSVSILQAHYMEKTDEDLTRIAELPDSVIYSELRDD
ncbi:uncharacterized protein C8R40DRAFT_512017 [Lentinula edodes]|uniref:uncharacterized protein n=1 Tax=Lentinula edodes TaxID=5353 RepID=UPI001E8EA115|nr:uncharacterized protein C8R40DRAFT_512017 [Lentinula edodes]KAH7871902.1 hypothetical protein C8R40DRAFT_512017 [Lentinula edodes]